ncbi:MAG: hypothetical protein RJA78_381 [Actinomycetota bacterium]
MIRKYLATSLVFIASSLALTGCITVNNAGTDHGGMMHGSSEFNGSEVMFAQMMIPHHEQAVLISTWAETRAASPEVKDLALQIKGAQAPEIEQMKTWLPNGYDPASGNHGMEMSGMLDAEALAELEAANGYEFDVLFLHGMIAHHEGAIEMTSMLNSSTNTEAKALREAIVENQSAEIGYMKELLTSLN